MIQHMMDPTYDPAVPLQGIQLDKTIIQKSYMHPHVHSNPICKNQNMGTT